jgi:hypothetical protein
MEHGPAQMEWNDTARDYWQHTLGGLRTPAPTVRATLAAVETGRLREFAQRHGLTANTVIQGAWGLLLAQLTADQSVLSYLRDIQENYPIDDGAASSPAAYPLSVTGSAGELMSVVVSYDPVLFDVATVERMTLRLLFLLAAITENADRLVSDVAEEGSLDFFRTAGG